MMEGQQTILAVEDEDDDAALLKRAFAKAGVLNPLRILPDGEQAQHYLEGTGPYAHRAAHPLPGLVLLDLKLPRKSGLEVLAWAKQQPEIRQIPIVVLTGSRQSADLAKAYDLGANSYLVKPVEFADLLAMVEALKLYWIRWNEPPSPTRPS